MKAWRLIGPETDNAFMNMAIDEAILRARMLNAVPNTLRIYSWMPSAVSFGRFQQIDKEVNVHNCRKHGVDCVRRITGGGAVYHDSEGEVTYSISVAKKDIGAFDAYKVYCILYDGLIEAIRALGLEAGFVKGTSRTCPNLMVGGRKISGSSQSHKKGFVLQHGTLLIDVDLKRMFTFLRVPWAETVDRIVKVARRRITSLSGELGEPVSIKEVVDSLVEGFEEALDIQLVRGELTSSETANAVRLCSEKFRVDEWNLHGRVA